PWTPGHPAIGQHAAVDGSAIGLGELRHRTERSERQGGKNAEQAPDFCVHRVCALREVRIRKLPMDRPCLGSRIREVPRDRATKKRDAMNEAERTVFIVDDARQGTVFIVDDARQVRMALSCILESVGCRVRSFDSAESFLKDHDAAVPGCLLLDVCMPGMSGLEL